MRPGNGGASAEAKRAEHRVRRTYRRVDRAVSRLGAKCTACGNCCYFDRGFVLYASSLEVEYLLSNAGAPSELVPGRCPYHGPPMCKAWDSRPLGCRTYFCESGRKADLEEIHNRALRVLKRVSSREGLGWRYAPLLELIAEKV